MALGHLKGGRFSPSLLGSTRAVKWAMLIRVPLSHPNNMNVQSFLGAPLSFRCCGSEMEAPKLRRCLCRYRACRLLRIENFDWAGQPFVAPFKLAPRYIVHLLPIWCGGFCFSCERWVGY